MWSVCPLRSLRKPEDLPHTELKQLNLEPTLQRCLIVACGAQKAGLSRERRVALGAAVDIFVIVVAD
jgi:hypothetical protein